MSSESVGVAVIGAGMAGRAHAAAYRSASTVFDTTGPAVRLVSIADVNSESAEDARTRYGYQRVDGSWQAIAEADDIDAVSVVVDNRLHREIVEGLLASGKHVLCEKPLAPSTRDAEAMVAAAEAGDRVAAVGYTYRHSPAVAAIRREITEGNLGDIVHINARYWADYALNPEAPMVWRYQGEPGSGALADLGSHLLDISEYLCGPLTEISGGQFHTVIGQRPVAAGAVTGHELAALTGETAPVENEDLATCTGRFDSDAVGTFSISRVAHGLPNGLAFDVFGTAGSASFDLLRPAEFTISDNAPHSRVNGHRRVVIGPKHPYISRGLPMDADGQGHGVADIFVYQARAFLDQVSGAGRLAPCPSLRDGLHDMRVLEAVTRSATTHGTTVKIG